MFKGSNDNMGCKEGIAGERLVLVKAEQETVLKFGKVKRWSDVTIEYK